MGQLPMHRKSLIVWAVALAVLGMRDRQQPRPLVSTHGSAIPVQGNRATALASSVRFENVANRRIASLTLPRLRSQRVPSRRGKLAYAAYLAGNSDDVAQAVAADGRGNVYVTGSTQSTTFPVVSAAQRANGGGMDAFVIKLDPRGHVIYSTYLGGRGDDAGSGVAVDSAGDAYVTGWTHSGNFPTVTAAQQRFGGVFDAFVSKLSPNGARLLFSTYLGGANDDRGNAIALGGADQVFIAGSTTSVDFPTMLPLQATIHGSSDAFAATFTSGGTLRWSSYYGGAREDTAHGVAVDRRGNVYLSGSTSSFDFPVVAPLQRAYGGGRSDAWMAKISATPRAVLYSTYLGGRDADQAFGITVDAHRNLYLTGATSSRDFPIAHAHQNRLGGGSCLNPSTGKLSPCTDVFVAEVNETGRKLLFSTFLGGTGDDAGHSLALDGPGNIYVGGVTNSSNFPVRDALQKSFGGGTCDQGYGLLPCSDAFLLELTAGGRKLAYGTYLGGPANDVANGVAVDKTGSMYVTGFTWSPTFPAGASTHTGPRPSPHAFVTHDVSVPTGAPNLIALKPWHADVAPDHHTNGMMRLWLEA
jgi:Beta-propeller repeat